jgi:hypothetical protein
LVRRDKDLDNTPDLFITPDDRIDLALAGLGGQVSTEFLQAW